MAGTPESTPEALLTIWLKTNDERLKFALARNPSTPVEALFRLWAYDPGAILENPVVLLWEFTKPGSPQKILPASIRFSLYQFLLGRPDFERHASFISGEEVVRLLGKKDGYRLKVPAQRVVHDERSSVRLALLEYAVQFQSEKIGRPVGFSPTAIDALAADLSKPVLQALAGAIANGWIVPEPLDRDFILRLVWRLHANGGASIAQSIEKWSFLDSDLVEKLASGADDALLAVLARHPNAPLQFLSRMVDHNSAIVRASVAASIREEAQLRRLFLDHNPLVRCGVASSQHLPCDLQWRLLECKDSKVLLALLKNPATQPEILEHLAGLPHLGITHLLRKHPNTPAHVRDALPEPRADFWDFPARG